MGFQKKYFKQQADAPQPLLASVTRRVRFEEVDALGMVWHGRFPSYFEDGRISFGDKYGLTYQSFKKNQIVAPVVQMHVDFKHPLRFDETVTIETRLHWSDAVKLNFSFEIYNHKGDFAAGGYTVQLLTEPDGTVMFVAPPWLSDFRAKWQKNYWEKR